GRALAGPGRGGDRGRPRPARPARPGPGAYRRAAGPAGHAQAPRRQPAAVPHTPSSRRGGPLGHDRAEPAPDQVQGGFTAVSAGLVLTGAQLGRSARVTVACRSRPSRTRVSRTWEPGRRRRSSPNRSSTVSTLASSRRTITSPGCRPAWAAGPPPTPASPPPPRPWPRPRWAATSLVTWSGWMPR